MGLVQKRSIEVEPTKEEGPSIFVPLSICYVRLVLEVFSVHYVVNWKVNHLPGSNYLQFQSYQVHCMFKVMRLTSPESNC